MKSITSCMFIISNIALIFPVNDINKLNNIAFMQKLSTVFNDNILTNYDNFM